MSLIEQLGGYEKAKAFLNATSFTIDELIMMQRSGLRTQHVEKSLLEYRRQHTIFEVGDKVVCKYEHTHLFGDVVLEIAYFRDDLKELGRFVRFTNGNDFKLDALRHATNAEIKSGRRL